MKYSRTHPTPKRQRLATLDLAGNDVPNSTTITEAGGTPDQTQDDTLSQIEKNGIFFLNLF